MITPFKFEPSSNGFQKWIEKLRSESSWGRQDNFPKRLFSDCHLDDDIFYSNQKLLTSLSGKKILIIGGGPSTLSIDFKKLNYDQMWSVNHFFLNPGLSNTKLDLVFITGETDITSRDFLKYRNKYDPLIGIELHSRWKGYELDDYSKYFTMHTNFYSKLGICVRLMIFACKNCIFAN